MDVNVYNQQGEETGAIKLAASIFGIKIKPQLIHQVVVAMMSNLRKPLAHTKTRGEVRGGGKKPWRQKGTGRARAGSIRSPLWRGGGIIFGPRKERNFHKKVNKKIKRLALKMVLSDKAANNQIIVLDKFEISKIRTKEIIEVFKKLNINGQKTVAALDKNDKNIQLSFKNIPRTVFTLANNLNLLDLLNHRYLLITKDSLKMIEKTYK